MTSAIATLFNVDSLATIIIALVGFIAVMVGLFASRYMRGDSRYGRFFCLLILLTATVMIMAAADDLLLFLFAWGISNLILIQLMTHKPQWLAAANSGWLTAKTFLLGYLGLTAAFSTLYLSTGQTSIQAILATINHPQPLNTIAALLLILAAMTQSAIWPFHRWLLSSLNAPTPVSAIMHAGLVNGGGVLLARFAPLYFSQATMLTVLFILGISTAMIGSIWKLMQSDIKRMLACSTMAQMGFMFAQCGLGLFPAAITHFCWHGLFKANLFLQANGIKQEKNLETSHQITITQLTLGLIIGAYGSYIFASTSQQPWLTHDTRQFLLLIVFITASQFNFQLLEEPTLKRILASLLFTTLVCAAYGYNIFIIEKWLRPTHLMQPQPLNLLHALAMALLITTWALMTLKYLVWRNESSSKTASLLYVKALNASQPHPKTITTHRHQYQYH